MSLANTRLGREFSQTTGWNVLIYGGGTAIALIAGLISASSRLSLIALFIGLIAAVTFAFSRRALLWLTLISALVVTGVVQLYLPDLRYVKILVPLTAGMLFVHGLMDAFSHPQERKGHRSSAIVFWAYAFFAIALISMVLNWDGFGLATLGLKSYFQVWIFFFALLLAHWTAQDFARLPQAFLWLALLQLPFVLHQYLVLAPLRVGLADDIIPVDIVAGTFGATLFGGGANAVLAAFIFIVIACLLGLWKYGVLSKTKVILFSVPIMAPVLFNEAKISAVYLPLIFLVLFYKDIVQKPLRFLLLGGALFAVFALIMTALTLSHPSGNLRTWSDLISLTFEKQTTSLSERKGEWGELTRWTSLTFWAEENIAGNPFKLLIGHGPGASRVQDSEDGLGLASTLAETRYRGLRIGVTGISALLWDTGVLGLAAMLGLFYAAYRTAGKLASEYAGIDKFRAGIFDGLRAGIAVLVVSLAHKDFIAFHIPYQTLILFIFGYLVVARYQLLQQQRETLPVRQPFRPQAVNLR
jgi:hypothetical protein